MKKVYIFLSTVILFGLNLYAHEQKIEGVQAQVQFYSLKSIYESEQLSGSQRTVLYIANNKTREVVGHSVSCLNQVENGSYTCSYK